MHLLKVISGKHQTSIVGFAVGKWRAYAAVSFYALWIYAALLMMPFAWSMPEAGIDGSHAFGSNYFPYEGFRYGSDVIFTYGPLGYLVNPQDLGNHIAVANVIRAAVWLLLFGHLMLLYRLRTESFWKAVLLTLALIPSRNLFILSFDYYLLAAMLVCILYLIERPGARLAGVSIVLLTGILALTKFSSYIMALACAALLLAARRDRWNQCIGIGALAALPVAFLLYDYSFIALFDYVYGGLQLASGYNEAMSIATEGADLFYAIVLAVLFVIANVYALARRALDWKVSAVLFGLYWLNFKHGFVRSDGHTVMAFLFEIIIAAVLICLLRGNWRGVRAYAAALPVIVFLALTGTNPRWSVWQADFWSIANTLQPASDLLNWHETRKRIAAEASRTDEFQQLPQTIRAHLEGAAAVVFPTELAFARSGHFRLQPLYTMQAYSAYTQYLDRKTAEHVRGSRDHTEFVLLDWQSIDDRHPLLDVPSTWMALVDNYEIDSVAKDRLLLKKRSTSLHHDQQVVQQLRLPIGKWVDLPETDHELWASIRISYSPRGSLRKAAYKANAIYLTVKSAAIASRFRVVPGVLSTPFPLNSFPVDFDAFVDLIGSNRVDSRIMSVRLDTDTPEHYREPSLELLQERAARITFEKNPHKSFQAEFHLASPLEIAKLSTGNIDVINDTRNPPAFPDGQRPLIVTNGTGLTLEGWLADKADGRAFDHVYAVVNGRLYRASTLPRPDVGAFFKNPALDKSGFHIHLATEDLRKGVQTVDLIGITEEDQVLYRYSKSVYAEVR
jgi:hypothetical protein